MIVIAISRVHEAAEIGQVGAAVGDVERTGRSVAAEQRTLRPAQDLDTLDINELTERHTGARLICAVDEDADRAFEADIVRGRTHTANTQHHRAGRVLRLRGREAGRDLGDVLHVHHALRFELGRADGGHGQRNVLHVFGALGRRHDDDVVVRTGLGALAIDLAILRSGAIGRLREGRCCKERAAQGGSDELRTKFHSALPSDKAPSHQRHCSIAKGKWAGCYIFAARNPAGGKVSCENPITMANLQLLTFAMADSSARHWPSKSIGHCALPIAS